MINAKLMEEDGILIVEPRDKLQQVDFERLSLLADPYIEQHGGLNGLLIDAESFFGWEDFASLVSHVHFVRDHEKKIQRVAAVTDNRFLAILPSVASHFVSAELRHFHYRDRNLALKWLGVEDEFAESR